MRIALLLAASLTLALSACARTEAPSAESPAAEANAESAKPTAAAPAPATEPTPAAPTAAPVTDAGTQRARYDGYGDMRFGMTVDEAKKAWGGELNGQVQGAQCTYLNPKGDKAPSYFAFMFEGGRFVRYDVGNDEETAPGGGKRGMTETEIEALYARRVVASPHEYVQGGKYLKVKADGGAVVFETDAAGKVTEWHAGVEPQVDYIEGCS